MYREYLPKDKEVMKKVGERVRFLREEMDLTQQALAIEADLRTTQVGRVERAENKTSLVTLNRIADALEVPLSSLFLFED